MQRLILSFALLLSFAGGAAAADLPTYKAPPAPVVPPPTFSWAGPYVGAQAGGEWGSISGPFGNSTLTGFGPYTVDPAGVLLGGYVGYNWQWQSLVFGVEGDLNGAIGAKTTKDNVLWDGLAFYDIGGEQTWTADARLRAGYAIDRLLLYFAGGLAFGDVRTTYTNAGLAPYYTETTNRTGWTLGVGGEYAFTNSIVGRVEYRYTDLGSKAFNDAAIGINTYDDPKFTSNAVLVGLSYKLW